ncbi:YmdB family metallophosphoesterase [Myxococcota bacterium]|nr:YmdB family metallophosphoesterase [Myxococcota bacterium]MBU1380667.1 YmdB family metallophosphoesterase [Myxococcota bacterium]MBU1495875.1 YmdB family metallophosphoesterase [Myxococcota bacterium]
MQNNLIPNPFDSGDDSIRLLMFGDVVGETGVNAACSLIPALRKEWSVDLVIVNGENSNGFGMLPESGSRLFRAGVDVITGGNHSLKPKAAHQWLAQHSHALRPGNIVFAENTGNYYTFVTKKGSRIAVVNLAGQVFMDNADSPFRMIDNLLNSSEFSDIKHIIVDFHAEATGEKVALSHFLDGRVSIVAGTHTHVQTSDDRIGTQGTGFITDLGMCGPYDSIIGMTKENIIRKYLTGITDRYLPATGRAVCEGIAANLRIDTGKCSNISKFRIFPD